MDEQAKYIEELADTVVAKLRIKADKEKEISEKIRKIYSYERIICKRIGKVIEEMFEKDRAEKKGR